MTTTTKIHFDRTCCPICKTSIKECAKEGEQFLICDKCDLHFRRSIIDIDPKIGWEKDYYSQLKILEHHKLRRSGFVSIERMIYEHVGGYGRLLDVGCGVGVFLEIARQKGWDVFGVEPSAVAVKHAREKISAPIYHGEFKTFQMKNHMDIVTIFDVLRTISDPRTFIDKAYEILVQGGWLVIRESNALYGARSRRSAISKQTKVQEYMQEWTAKGIKKTLYTLGFQNIEVHPSPVFLDGNEKLLTLTLKTVSYSISNLVYKYIKRVVSPNIIIFARK